MLHCKCWVIQGAWVSPQKSIWVSGQALLASTWLVICGAVIALLFHGGRAAHVQLAAVLSWHALGAN